MIYHISSDKRVNGNAGGVEKFSSYLEKAINCILITPEEKCKCNFKKRDIIIGDGYFVEGFDPQQFYSISVIHGSWYEFWLRREKPSFAIGESIRQGKVWTNPFIYKVAVSESAKYYAELHHPGCKVDKIILNSIDTDLFRPRGCIHCKQLTYIDCDCIWEERDKPIVIYGCKTTDGNKGNNGLLNKIIEKMSNEFEFRYLDAKIGEEHLKMAQGDILLAPSIFEGNSFFALEGMSCGLIPIVSNVGLFEFTKFPFKVAEIVDRNASLEDWCRSIKYAWARRSDYDPRRWVCQNADFELFKQQWIDFIEEISK